MRIWRGEKITSKFKYIGDLPFVILPKKKYEVPRTIQLSTTKFLFVFLGMKFYHEAHDTTKF